MGAWPIGGQGLRGGVRITFLRVVEATRPGNGLVPTVKVDTSTPKGGQGHGEALHHAFGAAVTRGRYAPHADRCLTAGHVLPIVPSVDIPG